MASEATTVFAYIGAIVGISGGSVALFNAYKAVLWKKAELASTYLKELNSNEELVFACRALDWYGGRLVVPTPLRPLLLDGGNSIIHDRGVVNKAMEPGLLLSDLEEDPRLQIYRTALDSLLSWFSLVDNALQRKLFNAEDIKDAGYWVMQIENARWMDGFIYAFGYGRSTDRLREKFRPYYEGYGDQRRVPRTGGFGNPQRESLGG